MVLVVVLCPWWRFHGGFPRMYGGCVVPNGDSFMGDFLGFFPSCHLKIELIASSEPCKLLLQTTAMNRDSILEFL
ncbi:hypothetical protein V6N11_075897 [Hibiscus sabdariffa]|uniref:Secreted protein n=1 Tax=Hibiscus sabdariffa TaxID=183260 RepID=A0ABR2Q4N0_9ROSI